MRIAICFYGQTRLFPLCVNSVYENLFKSLECDIFVHTWIDSGAIEKHKVNMLSTPQYIIDKFSDINFDCINYPDYQNSEEILSKLLPLKDLKIECQHKVNLREELNNIYPEWIQKQEPYIAGSSQMIYSMQESNKMRINYSEKYNIHYDLVINSVLDNIWHSPVSCPNKTNSVISDIKYIYKEFQVSCKCFYSNENIISEFKDLLNILRMFIDQTKPETPREKIPIGERFLYQYFKKRNTNVEHKNLPFTRLRDINLPIKIK